jgi:site-specific recombinase XerD
MSDRSPLPTVVISPHAIRSCWVTQMIIAGLDFATLTRIFGDSVSVTWERYLKVDKSR